MPFDIAGLADQLDAIGLVLLDPAGVADVIPVQAAWMASACGPDDGRVDEAFDLDDADLVRKANEAWWALAQDYRLLDQGREFLLSLTLSEPDEHPDVRWVRVRLKAEWDVIGAGTASGLLGGPYGRPGFVMLSRVGDTVVAGMTWDDGISVLAVPNPHQASAVRKHMANTPRDTVSEKAYRNIQDWLRKPARSATSKLP